MSIYLYARLCVCWQIGKNLSWLATSLLEGLIMKSLFLACRSVILLTCQNDILGNSPIANK